MAVYPGTYIPKGAASTDKFNHLIDDLLTPRLMSFRQICIYDERALLESDGETWSISFGNLLEAAPLRVVKNSAPFSSVTDVDYINGTFKAGSVDMGSDSRPRDVVEASYMWDYFPASMLEGLFTAAISIINMTAAGPPTSYTIETAPTAWEGVIVDTAFAMCMERLLLDYDLWKYRLVFAIGPNDVYSGGGDVTGQIETLKRNAEERANRAMENPKFKTGNYISAPTRIYYDSINGAGSGIGRTPFLTGRLRGWRPNRIY